MLFPRSNRVIRDCIHQLIELDDPLREILDCAELQRLRWIRQTGLCYLVFPSAEHSRFSHSLGAYSVASKMFNHLQALSRNIEVELSPFSFDENVRNAFAVAALCHDIGHTPFSHVFENALLPEGMKTHEECTTALLTSEGSELREKISNFCDLAEVIQIYNGSHPISAICSLISGEYDVDRCDYLLRDSYFAGVEYGRYDLNWLIHTMSLWSGEFGQPLVLLDGARGVDALRQYLLARKFMYRHVYYHPTVRSAQLMLRSILERAQDIRNKIPGELVPDSLKKPIFEEGGRPNLNEFVETTDVTILTMIRNFADGCSDDILRFLAKRFLRRRFAKKVFDSGELEGDENIFADKQKASELIQKVQEMVLEAVGGDIPRPEEAVQYLVHRDDIDFRPTSLADLHLNVGGRTYSLEHLRHWGSEFNFDELAKPWRVTRLYVPNEARNDAERLIKEELRTWRT